MDRAQKTVFTRGSRVLDYWLAHAEGFEVRPGGLGRRRVARVFVDRRRTRASALIVRSAFARNRRLDPDAFAAVDPFDGILYLRPAYQERPFARAFAIVRAIAVAAGRVGTVAAVRAATAAVAAAIWLRPRLHVVALLARRQGRRLLVGTAAALARLVPRARRQALVAGNLATVLASGAAASTRRLGGEAWRAMVSAVRRHERIEALHERERRRVERPRPDRM